jgi:hypothetical protein
MTLPDLVGLCPDRVSEFYMPLDHGESLNCPVDDCEHTLVVYHRKRRGAEAEPEHSESKPAAANTEGKAT